MPWELVLVQWAQFCAARYNPTEDALISEWLKVWAPVGTQRRALWKPPSTREGCLALCYACHWSCYIHWLVEVHVQSDRPLSHWRQLERAIPAQSSLWHQPNFGSNVFTLRINSLHSNHPPHYSPCRRHCYLHTGMLVCLSVSRRTRTRPQQLRPWLSQPQSLVCNIRGTL